MTRAASSRPVTARVFVGSSAFLIGLVASTLVFTPIALLGAALPHRMRYAIVVRWSHFNIWWLAVTCGLTHRVEGVENIPDRPTIILSKHESAWETLSLQRYFAPQVWVLKRELLRIPFFGWGLATMRPIAIDRSSRRDAIDQVLDQGRDRLDSGCWVVVFPEGTRVPPGEQRRFKQGGARLASHTGFPVIPVAHNSGDFWPRNSFFKFPGVIRLVIGPAIDSTGRSAAEINTEAREWIEAAVAEIRSAPPSPRQPNR